MKIIFNHLKDFIKSDFEWKTYLWTFLFLSLAIFLNYNTKFQSKYILDSPSSSVVIFRFFLFYSCAWFIVAFPKLFFQKKMFVFKSFEFWTKVLLFIGLISLSSGFRINTSWFQFVNDDLSRIYLIKISTQLKCFLFYSIPLFVIAKIFDNKIKDVYGLKLKYSYNKIYFLILAIVAPLVIAASFSPDFIQAYPRYKVWQFENMILLPSWLSTSVFEFFYVLDFGMTEWMFRGALVLGMVSVLGKDAVLPMASLYVFIHFGKPLGETISSFFGGYFLGVLAYSTKHIWGGIFLHAGIALIMEIMGVFQYYVMGIHR